MNKYVNNTADRRQLVSNMYGVLYYRSLGSGLMYHPLMFSCEDVFPLGYTFTGSKYFSLGSKIQFTRKFFFPNPVKKKKGRQQNIYVKRKKTNEKERKFNYSS